MVEAQLNEKLYQQTKSMSDGDLNTNFIRGVRTLNKLRTDPNLKNDFMIGVVHEAVSIMANESRARGLALESKMGLDDNYHYTRGIV